MSAVEFFTCPVCGGDLEEVNKDQYRCLYCGKVHAKKSVDDTEDMLRRLFDEGKKERVDTARKNLFDAMHAEYVSSEECMGYAYILKGLVPDDYLANFAITANSHNDVALSTYLTSSSKEDMETYATAVLDFMLRSLTPKTCAAVSVYIERAFSPTSDEYRKYIGYYNDEAAKVNAGVFDTTLHRDAFIAYSSRDIDKALELCNYLEDNGITCFLSSRNLTHGRGAVENYEKSLETAMDNCNTFVFVSSKNSRSAGCEARSKELLYIMRKEQDAHPNENYDRIPQTVLKHRVEYLIGSYSGSSPYDKQVRSFFHDLDWATDMEDVASRIVDSLSGINTHATYNAADEPVAPINDVEDDTAKESDAVSDSVSDAVLQTEALSGEDDRSAADEPVAPINDVEDDTAKESDAVSDSVSDAVLQTEALSGEDDRSAADEPAEVYVKVKEEPSDRGADVPKSNPVNLFKYYKEHAENGNAEAQYNLGNCYYNAEGTEQDFAMAYSWWRKSAEQGNVAAQYNIGLCFYYGRGVKKDDSVAFTWWKMAAEQGHRKAQLCVAESYRIGRGVAKNIAKANEWLNEANMNR